MKENFALLSKLAYHKDSVHHWKWIRKCGERWLESLRYEFSGIWVFFSFRSYNEMDLLFLSSQVHTEDQSVSLIMPPTLITKLQATGKKICLNSILSKTFLLSFSLIEQEPWAQFNTFLNKPNWTPSVMLWDRSKTDMRGRAAKAVIAFGLLLRIKLKQVKSRVAVTTGHHECFHPSCMLCCFKSLI